MDTKNTKCSICWYPREDLIYKNPKCGHSYCSNCISKKHIPDQNIIRCFIPSCMGKITVDHMEDYFVQEQINIVDGQTQQMDENVQVQKPGLTVKQKQENTYDKQPYNGNSSGYQYQSGYQSGYQNQADIRQRNDNYISLNDTREYCSKCCCFLEEESYKIKSDNCYKHFTCLPCQTSYELQNQGFCTICERIRR